MCVPGQICVAGRRAPPLGSDVRMYGLRVRGEQFLTKRTVEKLKHFVWIVDNILAHDPLVRNSSVRIYHPHKAPLLGGLRGCPSSQKTSVRTPSSQTPSQKASVRMSSYASLSYLCGHRLAESKSNVAFDVQNGYTTPERACQYTPIQPATHTHT